MLYEINEEAVHGFKKTTDNLEEVADTLERLLEVGKRQSVLMFIDMVRAKESPFNLDELQKLLYGEASNCIENQGLDDEMLEMYKDINDSINQCVYLGLFRPVKE